MNEYNAVRGACLMLNGLKDGDPPRGMCEVEILTSEISIKNTDIGPTNHRRDSTFVFFATPQALAELASTLHRTAQVGMEQAARYMQIPSVKAEAPADNHDAPETKQ